MQTFPPPFPKRPRCRFTAGRVIGLLVLSLMAVLVIWHVAWRVGNNRAVARLEKAARERGEPVNVQELAATYPPIPDADNSYVALEQIWATEDPTFWAAFKAGTQPLPEQTEEDVDPQLPVRGKDPKVTSTNTFSPEAVAAMRRFLEEKQPHLAAVRAAMKRQNFRPNYDFKESYAMLLPHLARMKREAQYFQIEALDAIERGQHERALNAIADISQVGHCLKEDPMLIGQLVRLACYGIAISTAERLVTQTQPAEADCQRLEAILETMRPDDGLKRALIGERVFGWSVFDGSPAVYESLAAPAPGDPQEASPKYIAAGFRIMGLTGIKSAEKRLMGETYEQVLRCIEKPDYGTTDELQTIFEAMKHKGRQFPPKIMTLLLMPALEKAGEKFARLEASRRCAQTAIQVERHRLHHNGAVPEQLSQLPEPALTDPFDGQPLRLKKTATGYVVYSVGADHNDNGGVLERPKTGPEPREFDVGFRVARTKAR